MFSSKVIRSRVLFYPKEWLWGTQTRRTAFLSLLSVTIHPFQRTVLEVSTWSVLHPICRSSLYREYVCAHQSIPLFCRRSWQRAHLECNARLFTIKGSILTYSVVESWLLLAAVKPGNDGNGASGVSLPLVTSAFPVLSRVLFYLTYWFQKRCC